MRVVLDTNVLISGMLSPFGTCGEIVRMLTGNELTLCIDSRIIFEYTDVLNRPKFDITKNNINIVIDYIEKKAETHSTSPLPVSLPDSDDNPFMEVAISAKADYLVTGNLKHFPENSRFGINVLSPREFIDYLRKQQDNNMDQK